MNRLLLLCVYALTYSSVAFSFPLKEKLVGLAPYAGVEAQMRHNRLQKDFGGNVFTKRHPQANAFLGMSLSESVSLEVGRKFSAKRVRNGSAHQGSSKLSDWHAEVIGLVPMYKQDCIALLASAGVARANLLAKDKVGNTVGHHTFSKNKFLPTAGVGIQAAVDEKTYLRARVNWEQYSKFKSIVARERGDATLKPRDNFVYSLGVTFKFF